MEEKIEELLNDALEALENEDYDETKELIEKALAEVKDEGLED